MIFLFETVEGFIYCLNTENYLKYLIAHALDPFKNQRNASSYQ